MESEQPTDQKAEAIGNSSDGDNSGMSDKGTEKELKQTTEAETEQGTDLSSGRVTPPELDSEDEGMDGSNQQANNGSKNITIDNEEPLSEQNKTEAEQNETEAELSSTITEQSETENSQNKTKDDQNQIEDGQNETEARRNKTETGQNETEDVQNETVPEQNETVAQQNKTEVKQNEAEAQQNETVANQNETEAEQNETEAIQNETEAKQNETVAEQNETKARQNEIEAGENGVEDSVRDSNGSPSSTQPEIAQENATSLQNQTDTPTNISQDHTHNKTVRTGEITVDHENDDVSVNVLPQRNTVTNNSNDQSNNGNGNRRVHFSEEVRVHEPSKGTSPGGSTGSPNEASSPAATSPTSPSRESLPCVPQLSVQQLIEGVVYQAQYLGSTPVIFSQNQKTVRMQQAREAVRLMKEAQLDSQPRIDVDLKINIKNLVLADTKTENDLITHPLRTVSYVADIENSLVIMAHRNPPNSPGTPLKLNCHILETADPREVAMVIGQAFSTAYKEFLKSHGIKEESLDKFEYQHVLSSQSKSFLEINSLADDTQTKEISFAKHKGDILGLMVIDSGYGSAIPSCVVAHMNKSSAAFKSGLINVGDHILSINGTSLVGMPLKLTIEQIKKCRSLNVVKMVTSSCPPVVDVTIMRPDLKFQLGFSVKDGNVCSLWRGSIAERSGIRVGHRIIEINGTSVVGLSHEEIVHMLSTTVGDIHIRTMPMVMYQLMTGQTTPEYY